MEETDRLFRCTFCRAGSYLSVPDFFRYALPHKAPAGKETNWVQTIPGKAWFTILRLYGPLEPWFKKTWRPDDIKLVK